MDRARPLESVRTRSGKRDEATSGRSSSSSPGTDAAKLQRTIGNRQTARLLSGPHAATTTGPVAVPSLESNVHSASDSGLGDRHRPRDWYFSPPESAGSPPPPA